MERAKIQADVKFEKRSTLLTLFVRIQGTVELTCDRCLEPYDQPVVMETAVYVKFGEARFDDTDDVLWVSPKEHHINIAQLLYENIVLSIPVKHVHPNDNNGESTCNEEMLTQIKKYTSVDKKETEPDQRWEVLRKLMNNN